MILLALRQQKCSRIGFKIILLCPNSGIKFVIFDSYQVFRSGGDVVSCSSWQLSFHSCVKNDSPSILKSYNQLLFGDDEWWRTRGFRCFGHKSNFWNEKVIFELVSTFGVKIIQECSSCYFRIFYGNTGKVLPRGRLIEPHHKYLPYLSKRDTIRTNQPGMVTIESSTISTWISLAINHNLPLAEIGSDWPTIQQRTRNSHV